MPDVNTLPEWFGAAVIGGVLAAVGYVAKLCVEAWTEWRRRREARLRQLLELASLLHASYEAFHVQGELVSRLEEMLSESHPEVNPGRGLIKSSMTFCGNSMRAWRQTSGCTRQPNEDDRLRVSLERQTAHRICVGGTKTAQGWRNVHGLPK